MNRAMLDCVAAYENVAASEKWPMEDAARVLSTSHASLVAVRRLLDGRALKVKNDLLLIAHHPSSRITHSHAPMLPTFAKLAPRTPGEVVRRALVHANAYRRNMSYLHLGPWDNSHVDLDHFGATLTIKPRQITSVTPSATFALPMDGSHRAGIAVRAAFLLWCETVRQEWTYAARHGLEEHRPLYLYATETPVVKRHDCTSQWNCCPHCRYRRQVDALVRYLQRFDAHKTITLRSRDDSLTPGDLLLASRDFLNRCQHHGRQSAIGALYVSSRRNNRGGPARLHAHVVLARAIPFDIARTHAERAGIVYSHQSYHRRPDATGQAAKLDYVLRQTLTDDPSLEGLERARIWTPTTRYRAP